MKSRRSKGLRLFSFPIPRYNEVRRNFGSPRKGRSRDYFRSRTTGQARLVYPKISTSGSAPSPRTTSITPSSASCSRRSWLDQFTRLRDGERFCYQTYLPPSLVQKIEAQPLSAIIKRNIPIGDELQRDVFRAPAAP